ncbi:DsrE family protein [Petrachloros mirabilis]
MVTRKLGLLLSTGPSPLNVDTVALLSEAAIRKGVDVYLYLIDEGVKNMKDPRLAALLEKGIKMSVCAYGCQQHNISTSDIDSRISLSGLVVLSGIIDGCDRFVAFT